MNFLVIDLHSKAFVSAKSKKWRNFLRQHDFSLVSHTHTHTHFGSANGIWLFPVGTGTWNMVDYHNMLVKGQLALKL